MPCQNVNISVSVPCRAYSKCTRAWPTITVREWGLFELRSLPTYLVLLFI
jgi:hypothetical protein